MDIEKVLYHLKEADKALNELKDIENVEYKYDHQSYLIAMANVFDFVNSLKPISCANNVVRDDY